VSRVSEYRFKLNNLSDWDPFLLEISGLPGPRGNLELARAVAEEGDEDLFDRYLTIDPIQAPANSPQEFLHFCGTLGLGKLVVQGQRERLDDLRRLASDPRWRTREAVAMALQWIGEVDIAYLLTEMNSWSSGNRFEQRAAAAGLCEPHLLNDPLIVEKVLQILETIMNTLPGAEDKSSEGFLVLKKGLAYCWSVAVAAHPVAGKPALEKWIECPDPAVRWVIKENLKKSRLERIDPDWVAGARRKMNELS
jgi:hypothetical protein